MGMDSSLHPDPLSGLSPLRSESASLINAFAYSVDASVLGLSFLANPVPGEKNERVSWDSGLVGTCLTPPLPQVK